jgi:uncharacterized membrane protein YhaH (DUF805 family)
MSFGEAISSGINNYLNFEGRASRSAYWYFQLFFGLVLVIAIIMDELIARSPSVGMLRFAVTLVFFLPLLTAGVRRLHDNDRSGWWMLLGCIPIIGDLILLVWQCNVGTNGPNRFGADPLGGKSTRELDRWSAVEDEEFKALFRKRGPRST